MLSTWDWLAVGGFLAVSLGISLYAGRQAGRSLGDYFLGGRGLSGWLAGLSMVATTFAADTPLAVTELVRQYGISGNWLWWNMLLSGMLTTFFFARLWRRAGVSTDLELITLRYSGPVAHWLRGYKAVYIGLLLNGLIIGWVNLALLTILQVFFGWSAVQSLSVLAGLMALTAIYSAIGGLRGIALTDAFQFGLAMLASVALAVLVLRAPAVGGLAGLTAALPQTALDFLPQLAPSGGDTSAGAGLLLGLGAFLSMVGLQWWASWYPGAEPGGGGYVVQRLAAARDERHALGAAFLFNLFHYAVRPWPWILVGLATVVLYPELGPDTYRQGYVMAMRDFLPVGLRGLLLAAFLAAYMSTISTQLNWGASYLLQDLYVPYLAPGRSQGHYVWVSRLATLLLAVLGLGLSTQMQRISGAWELLLNAGAGVGLVLMLRWYWWRVSAWSELAATLIPAVCVAVFALLANPADPADFFRFANTFPLTVGITTVGWLAVTYLTPPTDPERLRAFYLQVRPQGAWRPVRLSLPTQASNTAPAPTAPLWVLALAWLLGSLGVYSLLFAVGALLVGTAAAATLWAVLVVGSGLGLWSLARRYRLLG
jgi:Na+/proline symporter